MRGLELGAKNSESYQGLALDKLVNTVSVKLHI